MRANPNHLCYLLGPHYSEWLWDAETLARVTPHQITHMMSDRMQELFGLCRVWVPFANIGSEALILADQGFDVLCSEKSRERLERNLSHTNNPRVLLANPCWPEQWPDVDVVLLNPPWGSTYSRQSVQSFDLASIEIDGQSFAQLFLQYASRFNVIVICPTRGVPFDQRFPADHVIELTKLRLLFYVKK